MEDGEIIEDEIDLDFDYNPLTRPAELLDPGPRMPIKPEVESEPEEEESSSDGSDSDDGGNRNRQPKKPKIKPIKPRLLPQAAASRPKKYDIWCAGLQEEVLTRGLNSCDVDTRPNKRDRSVETYDYMSHRILNRDNRRPLSPDDPEDMPPRKSPDLPASNKRSFSDSLRGGVKNRLGWKPRGGGGGFHQMDRRGTQRILEDLVATEESTVEEFANDLTQKLNEEKGELILKIVQVLGAAKCKEIFGITKAVEQGGGMLIMNQTRRRTSGGVFLFHVRNACNSDESMQIFEDNRKEHEQFRRQKRSQKRRESAQQNLSSAVTNSSIATMKPENLEDGELEDGELEMKTEPTLSGEDEDPSANVRNPPPSPVTDGRADSSPDVADRPHSPTPDVKINNNVPGRLLTSYDDDVLDLHANLDEMDDMETF